LSRGKKYPYYRCTDEITSRNFRAPRGHAPNIPARWLEETVWADVRQFLDNPGEVLARVREQMESDDETSELEERLADLATRLATKHKERDRWLHLYTQGHISEGELELHLADVGTQLDNLKLLLSSVESDLATKHEEAEVAESTKAWLLTLRERLFEVEEDTEEAFEKRRQLVKLLVAGITAGKDEDGRPDVRITYRFGPPEPAHEEVMVVHGIHSSTRK
jgi:molybdopterin converting factor small subunit